MRFDKDLDLLAQRLCACGELLLVGLQTAAEAFEVVGKTGVPCHDEYLLT